MEGGLRDLLADRPGAMGMTVLLCAVAYVAIGVASALITNPIEAPRLQAALRLVALFLGAAVFAVHTWSGLSRAAGRPRLAATRPALAVALGALFLAVYTVLYNLIERSRSFASVALVLAIWPMVTGLLAYAVALVLARVMGWWRHR